MMDYDSQLKVQAYLDGELAPRAARRLEQRLAQDTEAQSLLAELKATASALAALGEDVKLPESREFFWSKIEREIEREIRGAAQVQPGDLRGIAELALRQLVRRGRQPLDRLPSADPRNQSEQPSRRNVSLLAGWRRWLAPVGAMAAVLVASLLAFQPLRGPEVETALSDAGAFTYRDFAAGTTLVWFSYPAEEDPAEDESADSLD